MLIGSIAFLFATILFFVGFLLSPSLAMAQQQQQTTTTTTTGTGTAASTMPASSSSGLELSLQPIYQEVSRQVGENLINDTHVETTFVANGTLTLPNTTEAISTTSTGGILISFMEGTAIGEQVITTEDDSESATAKFFGIARFDMEQEGTGRGIVIAVVQTNSTGVLAPLDGMILVGQGEFSPEGTSTTTLWEWQGSGVPLPTATTATTTPIPEIELSPQPIYQDQVRGISETLVNETYTLSTVSGNGTLTLANGTETIRTTSSGNIIVFDKFILPMKGTTTATATGKQILTIEDGSESATASFYEIARFNLQDYTGKGITIAVVHTNSTGMLAPLDGMILVGQEEFRADGSRLVTMWEWQSGVPLPPNTTTNATTSASGGGNATDDFLYARGGGGQAGGSTKD
jgi:hypothetical protein